MGDLLRMAHFSYIKDQIAHFRTALKVIEDHAEASPEDAGLRELKEIYTNRICSLEMIARENDETHEPVSGLGRFNNAA